jgi:hypothetical protein
MAAATETFDWAGDVRPLWTRNEAVLYHLHPHAFTAHPSCPVSDPAVRGTFKGVEENLPYLVRPLPGGVDRMGVVRLVRAKRLKRRRIKRASGGWVLNCLNCLNFGRRGWRKRADGKRLPWWGSPGDAGGEHGGAGSCGGVRRYTRVARLPGSRACQPHGAARRLRQHPRRRSPRTQVAGADCDPNPNRVG